MSLAKIEVEMLHSIEHTSKSFNPYTSYSDAMSMRKDGEWQQLQHKTVGESLEEWHGKNRSIEEDEDETFGVLPKLTARNYRSGMKILKDRKYIYPEMNLQQFALVKHNSIIDSIKLEPDWTEATRQARAACYISFTRYLARQYDGLITRAIPSKEGSKTFHKVREKVETMAISEVQCLAFMDALEKINPRDGLIAKIIYQGAKRVNEVLTLTTDRINWENNQITFPQSKTKGVKKDTVITYADSIMETLRNYLSDRKGLVFVTQDGKLVAKTQLARTFARAGLLAGITSFITKPTEEEEAKHRGSLKGKKCNFKMTPHVLRATAITALKNRGHSTDEIQKISGQTPNMLNAYDKRADSDNISKKVSLVS